MPKRLKLTPRQRDIIWVLEEAGEETLCCILNTLKTRPDEASRVGWEFQNDLSGLMRLGLVSWATESSGDDAIQLAHFDSDTKSWSAPSTFNIYLTEKGQEALTH